MQHIEAIPITFFLRVYIWRIQRRIQWNLLGVAVLWINLKERLSGTLFLINEEVRIILAENILNLSHLGTQKKIDLGQFR